MIFFEQHKFSLSDLTPIFTVFYEYILPDLTQNPRQILEDGPGALLSSPCTSSTCASGTNRFLLLQGSVSQSQAGASEVVRVKLES